jgi:sugar phosphate isomerase/epimerase
MRPGLQLYTIRECGDSVVDRIERVAETTYEGVQISGLGDDDPAEIADALARTGLDVAGAHVGLAEIESDPDAVVDTYATFGCRDLVVPSYDSEAFETRTGAAEAGRRLAAAADRLAERDARLHYHNHTFEFTPTDGGTAFDAFADAAEGVGLEVDVGLASHGGADPVALLDRYGDRTTLVHLTDSRAGSDEGEDTRHVDLGEGEVDLRGCVDAAADAGAEWLLFEHGLSGDPVASMERAEAVIADLLE